MDKTYLKYIAGSPYVDEQLEHGIRNRFKMVRKLFRGGTFMLEQLSPDPKDDKLLLFKQAWINPLKTMEKALSDLEGQIDKTFQNRRDAEINPITHKVLRKFTSVQNYQFKLLSSLYAKIRQKLSKASLPVTGSSVPGSPPLGSGGSVAESLLLNGLLEESWNPFQWFGGKKSKAVKAGNVDLVLSLYAEEIRNIYLTFIDKLKKNGIETSTLIGAIKAESPELFNLMSNIVRYKRPASGWSGGSATATASPGDVTATVAGPSAAPAETAPTIDPSATSAAHLPASSVSVSSPGEESTAPIRGRGAHEYVLKDPLILNIDIPYIILRAVETIVDSIKSDVGHSRPYFEHLPRSWYEPAPTGDKRHGVSTVDRFKLEPEAPLTEASAGAAGGVAGGAGVPPFGGSGNRGVGGLGGVRLTRDEMETDVPGEILYNIASKHRKSRNFSIEFIPEDASLKSPILLPNVSKQQKKSIRVKIETWLACKGSLNTIMVKILNLETKHLTTQPIMRFFDHEASTELGAGGDTADFAGVGKFTVKKIADAINPALMANVTEDVATAIAGLEGDLLAACYAIAHRKHMEWKSKEKNPKYIYDEETGDVSLYILDKYGVLTGDRPNPVQFTLEQIKEKLSGKNIKEKNKWVDILNHIKYPLEKFNLILPKKEPLPKDVSGEESGTSSSSPSHSDANKFVEWLKNMGWDNNSAINIATNKWNYLIKKFDPDTIDFDSFKKTMSAMDYWAYASAKEELIKRSINPSDAIKLVNRAWNIAIKTPGVYPEKITVGDIINIVDDPKHRLTGTPAGEATPSGEETPTGGESPGDKTPDAQANKQKREKILMGVNEKLHEMGLPTLDNLDQLNRLISVKGGYRQAGYNITGKNKGLWEIMVSVAKGERLSQKQQIELSKQKKVADKNKDINPKVKAKAKAKTKTTKPSVKSKLKERKTRKIFEEIINPFQSVNFL